VITGVRSGRSFSGRAHTLYTVYTLKMAKESTSVLTIRVPRSLDRRLTAAARRSRCTRSEAARAILEAALNTSTEDPLAAARRQSLLASRQDADADTLAFIQSVADVRGWK
jgi:hypothetical protein